MGDLFIFRVLVFLFVNWRWYLFYKIVILKYEFIYVNNLNNKYILK